jgi:hypothetical protein
MINIYFILHDLPLSDASLVNLNNFKMLSLLSLKRQGFCNHPANEISNAVVVDEYMNQEVDESDEDDGILSITVLGKASSSSVHATK